jgi:NADP-dependent 3-hydroxy acid dehydrogenase YdfG
MGQLTGQSALITGASAGIGRASAIALAREGAHIIATGRRDAELRGVADECRAVGIKADYLAGDITDENFISELGNAGTNVDILVNNAGILNYGPILEFSPDDSRAMFETNVLAALRVAQVIGKSMAARRRGHIIVVTSGAARQVPPMAAVYSATKHALAAITTGLRQELQTFGIRVSEVSPGMVDTNIRAPIKHPGVLAALKARTYSALSTDEVAAAVVFAATTPPNVVTGLIDVRPLGSS